MKRHHRIAVIIGLLNEDFPFAIHHKPRDSARPPADGLKHFAAGSETSEQGAIEFDRLTRFCAHLGVIESALRDQDPISRRARELVRKQVRVANAEAAEHDFALVRPPVSIRVAQKENFRSMLHVGPILVRKQAKWNRQPISKDAWLVWTGTIRIV